MKLVCLDTHILIWGIKEEASSGQENMVGKAKRFLKYLDDNKTKAMITAVVLGEFLLRIPEESHKQVYEVLQRRFIIPPYDAAAASCCARIWQKNNSGTDSAISRLIRDFPDITKRELRADCQIVATAITREAECIYTHDEPLQRFAESHIKTSYMPTNLPAEQLGLFGDTNSAEFKNKETNEIRSNQ